MVTDKITKSSSKSSKCSSIASWFKGALEEIRFSSASYCKHKTFYEFVDRFGLLAPEVLEGSYDEKVACQQILDKMGFTGCQFGKTKVFLKAGQMAELDARRAQKLSNAVRIIQRKFRTHMARKFSLSCNIQAARETDELKVKDKLEKHVEDLKLRLQLVRRLRSDMEDTKNREILILQQSLQVMQNVKASNALVIKRS